MRSRFQPITSMRIGLLSDLHCDLAPSRERSWINRYEPLELPRRLGEALGILSGERPDLILLLGDTTELADREAFDFVLNRVRQSSGSLIAAVAGNHDCDSTMAVIAESVAGKLDGGADNGALATSARAHDIRFLNADSARAAGVALLGAGIGRVTAGSSAGSGDFRGALDVPPRDGQFNVVASHFPLISHESEITAAGLPYSGDLVNRAELESLLQRSRVPTVVFSGHVHSRCSAASGNVLQVTIASMIESPFECTVVDIDSADDGLISVRRRAFTLGDPAAVNPVFAPADERWEWRGGWASLRPSPTTSPECRELQSRTSRSH
jgi:predicted phosphodiesterase